MNKIKLLIFHSDTEYALALSRALAIRDSIYDITLLTEELCYNVAISESMNKEHSLLLVDQEWKTQAEQAKLEYRERWVGLSEEPSIEDRGYIYKYGGLDHISSELQILYAEITGRKRVFFLENRTKFIGFTSSAGGVGTSCIAIAVGREMSSLDKRDALYLSFEEAESTSVYVPVDEGRSSISEYLYYLFTKDKEDTATFIDSFLISDSYGLCAFRPSKGVNELPRLSRELQIKFLDSLYCSGRFRYVFIDFHAHISPGTEQMMRYCDKIFLVDDGEPRSILKNQKFIESISPDTFEEIGERIQPITNKWMPDKDEMAESNRLFVEYDKESFAIIDSYVEINLHRCFGLGVRKIADELTIEI